MIERAPCIEQSHPLWFWELWTRGPFVLTDTAIFEIWEPSGSIQKEGGAG